MPKTRRSIAWAQDVCVQDDALQTAKAVLREEQVGHRKHWQGKLQVTTTERDVWMTVDPCKPTGPT